MMSDTPKDVSAIPLRVYRRRVTTVLFIVALTSSLVAIVWHLHADPLSAEEQRLVGTWRHFDANGKHIRDERYFSDRSTDRRSSMGDGDARMREWYQVTSMRWTFSDGQIHVRRPVSFDERADTWTGGRYVYYLGDFAFPIASRRPSTCKNSLKPIGLGLHNYAGFYGEPFSLPQPVFGESIQIASDDFPGEVHTLRRLVSAMRADSRTGWPSDD